MTDEQSAALDAAYRCFVVHLIAYNVRQMRDRRVAYHYRYHAQEFLQGDLCVYLVRLLGFGGSMTDEEIKRSLISAKNDHYRMC